MAHLFDFGLSNIDLWRSEEMHLVQLMIPSESAHETLAALGEVGLLQFRDLNADKSAFQRTYAKQVKRCDELTRKLRFLADQVAKAALAASRNSYPLRNYSIDELEVKLENLEKEVSDLNDSNGRLMRTYNELLEMQVMLEVGGRFFDNRSYQQIALPSENLENSGIEEVEAPLLESVLPNEPKLGKLGFIAGLILKSKMPAFERLLFRATRGNIYVKQADIGPRPDPASGEVVDKCVFVIFYSGERILARISKICDAFGANRYPFPEDTTRRRQMYGEVSSRLTELRMTLDLGDVHRNGILQEVADYLPSWSVQVLNEKGIYHTLNKLSVDVTSRVLVGEAWIPAKVMPEVADVLRRTAVRSSTQITSVVQRVMTLDAPPTYFRTNKFTECFQNIVDAYGIARYREVNPTVFTIMTFPFLFAVMFGDVGHGFLMLLFAILLLALEKQLTGQKLNDMVDMLFSGRYCILLMAFFSMYVGLVYNEAFSIPLSLWDTTHFRCYKAGKLTDIMDMRECKAAEGHVQWPGNGTQPYPFGVDPIWHGTLTELPYLNSLKMKMSILLGVLHMNLGILMSFLNNIYFRDTLSTVCEFIPQMIFLNSLFGYLSFLMVYKWAIGSVADLYHVLIYMFLSPGSMDDQGRLFDAQANVQVVLLLMSVASVPIMLIPKPLVLNARHKAQQRISAPLRQQSEYQALHSSEEAVQQHEHGQAQGHEHGEFEFGEVLVHQMIHTIEFVLGAVSNTASYLRLWALSLAHSQLSAVFYDRVLMASIATGGDQYTSVLSIFIGFFVFAVASLGVLMVMESLSAFLHALRLHWVEFQNKFYRGDGHAFVPFMLHQEGSHIDILC